MNDLETTKAMLDRAGVKYEAAFSEEDVATILTIKQIWNSEKNRGYSSFFTTLNFDTTGALMSVGAWEG